jgi:hypothetical protein
LPLFSPLIEILFFGVFIVGFIGAVIWGIFVWTKERVDDATDGRVTDWERRRSEGDATKRTDIGPRALELALAKRTGSIRALVCWSCAPILIKAPEIVITAQDWSREGKPNKAKCVFCSSVNRRWKWVAWRAAAIPGMDFDPDVGCDSYAKRGDGHCAKCGVHWYDHPKGNTTRNT